MSAVGSACWRRIGVYGGDQSCSRLAAVVHCRNCEVFAAAARGMFERASAPDTEAGGIRAPDTALDQRSALVFRLGEQWLAVAPRFLAEVAQRRALRRLAHRCSGLLEGVVNVRGELRLCVSLVELLGIGRRAADDSESARLILLHTQRDALIAFRADEVRGLQRYAAEQLEPAPEAMGSALKRCVEGLLALPFGHAALLRDDLLQPILEEALFE